MYRTSVGLSWALWNATFTRPAGCDATYPWWCAAYKSSPISASSFTQPQPPLRSVGTLLFPWHFGSSVHGCTRSFPVGKDFYSFWVRTLTKSYPAFFPTRLPCCPATWTWDHMGSGCEIVPGYRYKDLTGLLRVMGFHWRYATRKLSSSALLVFHFSPFLRMGRLFPHAAHKIIQAASVIRLVIESLLRFTKAYPISGFIAIPFSSHKLQLHVI